MGMPLSRRIFCVTSGGDAFARHPRLDAGPLPHDPLSLSACDEFRQPIADYRDGASGRRYAAPGQDARHDDVLGPGGQERTEHEYSTLLGNAGLRLTRVVPTESPVSVVEAGLA